MSPRNDFQLKAMRTKSKEKILLSAAKIFTEEGLKGASIQQIAKEADVSVGLLYHYFSSKEEVLDVIVNDALSQVENMLQDYFTGDPKSVSIPNAIKEVFSMLLDEESGWQQILTLYYQPEVFKRYYQRFQDFGKQLFTSLTGLFRKLGYNEPEIASRMIFAEVNGILMMNLAYGEEAKTDQLVQVLIGKYA
ncbi:MAG: TetR/AcrR family transcriptional regulator [Spirochaetia bacterium]